MVEANEPCEIVKTLERRKSLSKVDGVTFRHNEKIVYTPNRPLIENLDELPFPGYHFVKEHMKNITSR